MHQGSERPRARHPTEALKRLDASLETLGQRDAALPVELDKAYLTSLEKIAEADHGVLVDGELEANVEPIAHLPGVDPVALRPSVGGVVSGLPRGHTTTMASSIASSPSSTSIAA